MSQVIEVKVPDIGNYTNVPVIDVCVQPGDAVKIDSPLVTLESEKATMDVPSPAAGIVREIKVKLGDRISEGHVVAVIESSASAAGDGPSPSAGNSTAERARSLDASPSQPTGARSAQAAAPARPEAPRSTSAPTSSLSVPPLYPGGSAFTLGAHAHASPSVRFYARELGVDMGKVRPTGPKDRILKEDVTVFVKSVMSSGGGSGGTGLDLLPWPRIDFQKFGPVETKPLSKIKKISGQNLLRNWVMIPAVTYHDEADITELEAFRVEMNKENENSGVKITMLSFLLKACEIALKKYPEFNSSIDGENLVLKHYYHIGFAADTPQGLVVPVVKNVDQKSISEIATEAGALAKKARDGKLTPAEMSGACFTVSSLGGIGGTAFSPIVNAPEVAILGVSKSAMKPVWNGKEFAPRLILPMSLSADHRVIDGALATHFNVFVAQLLSDVRRLVL